MSAAAEVRGSTVDDDGTTTPDPDSSGEVNADGSFTLDVAADESLYLVQALDANGEVIGAAMLESTGSEGSETTTTPIDRESAVEAMAWLQAVAEAGDQGASSCGDVRGRIDATLAATVYGNWESGEGQSDMDALAAAVTAAQSAELWSDSDAGATTSKDAINDVELMLSIELSAQLYAWIEAGNDSTDDASAAQDAFMSDLYAYGTAELGLSADQTNDASANSGLAFAAVVESMKGLGGRDHRGRLGLLG